MNSYIALPVLWCRREITGNYRDRSSSVAVIANGLSTGPYVSDRRSGIPLHRTRTGSVAVDAASGRPPRPFARIVRSKTVRVRTLFLSCERSLPALDP